MEFSKQQFVVPKEVCDSELLYHNFTVNALKMYLSIHLPE